MIKIEHLNKSFNGSIALKDISLDIKKGKTVALIGPSGSGKSTLLRSLNLLERPESGKLTIDGLSIDFADLNKSQIQALRLKSAMVFQNYNLFANKNAKQNISEALVVTRGISRQKADQIAIKGLAQMNLEHKANAYSYELSGGQQQRVAIARALALGTEVLLFDEPTSALDVELVSEVLEAIKAIKNKTMIIVTHELEFAKEIADEIVFLADGEIAFCGTPHEFFTLKEHENQKLNGFLKRIEHKKISLK